MPRVRNLRLDPAFDERVRQAAAVEGVSVSEFIRRAAVERLEQTHPLSNSERLAYAIGAVGSAGGRRTERT
jgi:uncharacterized protein (DUF1778 family)